MTRMMVMPDSAAAPHPESDNCSRFGCSPTSLFCECDPEAYEPGAFGSCRRCLRKPRRLMGSRR